jgi:uncharacterized protein YuzE
MAVMEMFNLANLIPALRDAPAHLLRLSYDDESDVLYVSFGEPRPAEDADMDDEGVITRFGEDGEVVGYTVIDASKPRAA